VYQVGNSSLNETYGNSPYAALLADDIHWWFFTVHYLSLCGGCVGGTEDPEYIFLQCERKPVGWRFRTDDPFIVNFMQVREMLPVNSTVPMDTFSTAPASGTLVVGIAFLAFGVGCLAAEAFGGWSKSGRLAQGSVLLLTVWQAIVQERSLLILQRVQQHF
jgi:hypothetical protein